MNNNKAKYQGLILNNNFRKPEELLKFTTIHIISNDIPGWEKNVFQFIHDFLDDKDFIIQQTSGTTGAKKLLRIPKEAMISSARSTIEVLELKKNDNALLCLPIEYIAGKMMVVRALVGGMNLILTEPKGSPELEEYKSIDFCAMVPLQVNNLLNSGLLDCIKTLIIGGAEINPELQRRLAKLPNQIYETYGMAETCSHVALRRVNGDSSDSYFKSLPGIGFGLDSRGCLVINAPFLKEKVVTNDIVELIDNNQFKWLGRYDNIINTGGIKVHPEFLEQQIEEVFHYPCAVLGLPDPVLGQRIVLFVESKKELDKENLIESLKNIIDKKMIPKAIYVLDKLPRNESFKVDRKSLKQFL